MAKRRRRRRGLFDYEEVAPQVFDLEARREAERIRREVGYDDETRADLRTVDRLIVNDGAMRAALRRSGLAARIAGDEED